MIKKCAGGELCGGFLGVVRAWVIRVRGWRGAIWIIDPCGGLAGLWGSLIRAGRVGAGCGLDH